MKNTLKKDLRLDLNYMVFIIVAGLVFSVLFHLAQAFVFNLNSYPYNTFLFDQAYRFTDFNTIYTATAGLDPFKAAVSVYPPFTYLVMFPFTKLSMNVALGLMLAGFTLFLLWYVYRTVSGIDPERGYMKTGVLALLSYPFLFTFDRANMEVFVFILSALFIYFYQKKEDWKSVCCLAGAIAMKVYPGALLLVLLADRKYKKAFCTLLVGAALTLGSMLVLKGGVAASYAGLVHNLEGFRHHYFHNSLGVQHNLSLFGVMWLAYVFFLHTSAVPETGYFLAMVLLFIALALYLVFVEKELWRSVTLIVLYFLVAPQVSFDYKMVNLFVPIMLFFGRSSETRSSLFFASAFALLCIPKDYFLILDDVSIAVIINPLLILLMMGVLVYQGCRAHRAALTASPRGNP